MFHKTESQGADRRLDSLAFAKRSGASFCDAVRASICLLSSLCGADRTYKENPMFQMQARRANGFRGIAFSVVSSSPWRVNEDTPREYVFSQEFHSKVNKKILREIAFFFFFLLPMKMPRKKLWERNHFFITTNADAPKNVWSGEEHPFIPSL